MFLLLPFALGIAVGVLYCAPVGPVNLEIVRRGLSVGFLAAFLVALGSVIGDSFWAAVGILGSGLLMESLPLRVTIGFIGVLILLYLSWSAFRASAQNPDYHLSDPPRKRVGFAVGVALSMANPFAVFFWLWLAASGAMASAGVDSAHHVARVWFFTGLVTGAILYGVILSGIVAWSRRFISARMMRIINVGAAIGLLALAIVMTLRILRLIRTM
ncbi:MAG TPA: LysE family transporter [Gemmatimonadales bacterium]|nr:LysE family transporter [Gemmatimonadales bacterium]